MRFHNRLRFSLANSCYGMFSPPVIIMLSQDASYGHLGRRNVEEQGPGGLRSEGGKGFYGYLQRLAGC